MPEEKRNLVKREQPLSESGSKLQVFQHVSEAIHNTLDLKTVLQNITFSAVHYLDYNTAAIAILSDDKSHFIIKTLSSKKNLLLKINNILGFSLKNFSFPADPSLCPGIRSVLKGRTLITRTTAEVFYPLLKKKVCLMLQKLGNSKNCILVPLMIENEVVGGIFLAAAQEEISREELNMIKSFTGAAANAFKNAKLHLEVKRSKENQKESEELFRSIVENSHAGILLSDAAYHIIYVNDELCRMVGFSQDKIIGQDFRKFLDEESIKLVAERYRRRQKGENVPPRYEFNIVRKDGNKRRVEISSTVINNDKGEIRTVAQILDITKRKRAEKIRSSAYKISEAALKVKNLNHFYSLIHKTISELMPSENFYIAFYDSDSGMINFPYFIDEHEENPGPYKLGQGLTEHVLHMGKPLLASPEVCKELEKKGKIKSVGPESIDWLGVPLKAKEQTFGVMAVQSYSSNIRYNQEDKRILNYIAEQVAMAIDRKHSEEQIKKSLEEKEILLKEIHHRVKNNLNVIASLLNLQAGKIKNKREAIEAFKRSRDRIFSMALVHEKLYGTKDFTNINMKSYINEISRQLIYAYAPSGRLRLEILTDGFFLDINRAVPCGLILNELITNALKHAFPKERKGCIKIASRKEKDNHCRLSVSDDGVGLAAEINMRNPATLGLQLVGLLTKQIDGTLRIRRGKGTTFSITFPCSAK